MIETIEVRDKVISQTPSLKKSNFSIDEEDLGILFTILSSGTYSDKILAVIREYTTNAVDAHVEAGKADLPIKVTLPGPMSPNFVVRDFGLGMSAEQVDTVYRKYLKSTKKKSNLYIGAKGIGAKAGFAYSSSFIVNSYYDGYKTSYSAFVEEQIPSLIELSYDISDEPSGVEIVIPVKESDYYTFRYKAQNLFEFFDVYPDTENCIKKTERDYILEGKGWRVTRLDASTYNSATIARMGNIPYPINTYSANLSSEVIEFLTGLSNTAVLILDFPIGSLDVSTSRESLEYKERTNTQIKNKVQVVVEEIKAEIKNKAQNLQSLWHAKCLYGELEATYGSLSGFDKILQETVEWDGKFVQNNTLDTTTRIFGGISVRTPSVKTSVRLKVAPTILCDQNKTVFYINDMPKPLLLSQRFNHLRNVGELARDKNVYLVEFHSIEAEELFRESFKGAEMRYISDVPLLKQERYSNGGTRKSPTHKIFRFNPFGNGRDSNYWEEETLTDEEFKKKQVYVFIDRYKFLDGDDKDNLYKAKAASKLFSCHNALKALNKEVNIIGVRRTYKKELPVSWKLLKDYAKECIDTLDIETLKLCEHAADDNKSNKYFKAFSPVIEQFPKKSVVYKYVQRTKDSNDIYAKHGPSYENYNVLWSNLRLERLFPIESDTTMDNAYPLLSHLSFGYGISTSLVAKAVEYIKLVEANKKEKTDD